MMIYNAPQWSIASPQLTHGFPRRLIAQAHGGFLPGNITVAAKASNLTLRRLAVCDVACLVSRAATAGAGLSQARLLNLRYAAIRYHRGSFCPQYLASAMVEYGVNFATFEGLSCAALEALYASLAQGWRQPQAEEGDSSDSDGPAEPLITCTFEPTVMLEIGKSTTEAGGGSTGEAEEGADSEDDRTALANLLARFTTRQAESSSESSEEETEENTQRGVATAAGGRTSARAGSGKRKRKRASAGGGSSKARRTAEPADPSSAGEVFQNS